MDEPTLQRTLRQKYNINDRLLAEGRFVGLIGDHAASLVCLGLGIRCLVVAKVVLSGEIIDYDLISISPLPLLTLSFQNKTKKIKVRTNKINLHLTLCSHTVLSTNWSRGQNAKKHENNITSRSSLKSETKYYCCCLNITVILFQFYLAYVIWPTHKTELF